MNRQQICEKFTATTSKKSFTQCYRLLQRANCQHLKCFRAMKKVLKDKWYAFSEDWGCSYHTGKQHWSWAWYSGDRRQLNLIYEKENPFFARQKKDFPGAWIEGPWGNQVISVGKRHFGRELWPGFTVMGNFCDEFSEQSLVLADPVMNPSSPYSICVSLCLFPTLEAVVWWFVPPFLLSWGNTALGQPDFHFSIWLHVCLTDVLGCIQQERNRVTLKEAMVYLALYSLFPPAH